jgi:hypothetical protein
MAEEVLKWDWDNEKFLSVYEPRKSLLVVIAMCEALDLGHVFPEAEFDEDEEGLVVAEGGHRAVAHYLMDVPLPYHIGLQGFPLFRLAAVPGIRLCGGANFQHIEEPRLVDSLSYLPTNIAERFCHEHNLNPDVYLPQ